MKEESKAVFFLKEILPPLVFVLTGLISYFLMKPFSEQFPHAVQNLSFLAVALIPVALLLLFRFRVAWPMKAVLYLFDFLGMYLANACNFYQMIPNFDKILHWMSGPIVFFCAMYVVALLNKDGEWSDLGIAGFATVFQLAVGGVWEIIEYTVDVLLKNDAQIYVTTDVVDTMTDMIAMVSGSLLCAGILLLDSLLLNGKIASFLFKNLHEYDSFNRRPYKERKLSFR